MQMNCTKKWINDHLGKKSPEEKSNVCLKAIRGSNTFCKIHYIPIDKAHFLMKVTVTRNLLAWICFWARTDINISQHNSKMFYTKNTEQLLHIDCTYTFLNRKVDYTLSLVFLLNYSKFRYTALYHYLSNIVRLACSTLSKSIHFLI